MGKRYKGDNSGGYGNPPVKDQFQKGGPPGPGRPKGSRSMDGALRKVFGGTLEYRENNKPVKSTATVALAKRALGLGLTGPASANAAALELAAKYGPQDDSADMPRLNFEGFTLEEITQLEMLLSRALSVPFDPGLTAPNKLNRLTPMQGDPEENDH